MSLYQELKRRNVHRVVLAYIAGGWLIVQVAETLLPAFGFEPEALQVILIALAIGFFPALILSWKFEWTPSGLVRDDNVAPAQRGQSSKTLDRAITVVLLIAVVYFAVDKFMAGNGTTPPEIDKSIAVLPFANRSEQQADEYFTEGMHDELLTRLSHISELKVISRTSMMQYRGTDKSIPVIGEELSVATVLEGGVQRSGDQVRINVQLIDARTDEHLWAEVYDRELTAENLFAIQSEISTAIAESLEATLSPEERTRVFDLPTVSLDAYNHYLRGRQLMESRTRAGLKQALEEFEQAAEIDPDFALAWVGIADSVQLGGGEHNDEAGRLDMVEAAAQRALALDDQLGEAYASISIVYGSRGEHEKEIAALEKAIELSPNYAQAYLWYANSLHGEDRYEKGLALLYKAAELDPRSSLIKGNIAGRLMEMGREEEARDVVEGLLRIDPATGYQILAGIDSRSGRLAEAVRSLQRLAELDPGSGRSLGSLAMAYLTLGELESASGVLQQMEDSAGSANPRYLQLAFNYQLARGDYEAAIGILDALPEPMQAHPYTMEVYLRAYLLSGDFAAARETSLKLMPAFADPALWQQEITDQQVTECEMAGAMHEAGDDTGRELLRLFIRNYEAGLASKVPDSGTSRSMIHCYLIEGSHDKALDILEREIAGELLLDWWFVRRLPWWTLVEDNARYQELVNTIDGVLEEQRAMLQ